MKSILTVMQTNNLLIFKMLYLSYASRHGAERSPRREIKEVNEFSFTMKCLALGHYDVNCLQKGSNIEIQKAVLPDFLSRHYFMLHRVVCVCFFSSLLSYSAMFPDRLFVTTVDLLSQSHFSPSWAHPLTDSHNNDMLFIRAAAHGHCHYLNIFWI